MTALVGILNKRAAVIAADSAVTISRGDNKKVINTANKIFRLSKTEPIGVMIYGSADFMNIPWEVIIKLYRDKNAGKSFDTVQEYVNDFINFLRHEKHCIDKDSQSSYLSLEALRFYYGISHGAKADYEEAMENNTDNVNDAKTLLKCVNDKLKRVEHSCKKEGVGSDFEDYSLQQFQNYAKEAIEKLEKMCKRDKMPGAKSKWVKGFYNYIISKLYFDYTGVVFVGYGNDDIYPTIIPLKIAGFVDNRLRFLIEESDTIKNDNDACVCPYAQTDIMTSFMKGIHPEMYTTVLEKVDNSIDAAKQKMMDSFAKAGATDKQLTKLKETSCDDLYEKFKEEIKSFMYDTFVTGILGAVGSFNIEDMITMAESLISITNLQRHITLTEESVGGPVDVAVITKSEGFVWVNHKQWFQQQMNPQMMERR